LDALQNIRGLASGRMAYRFWLVKEEPDRFLFSDSRYLTFIRVFMRLQLFSSLGVNF
jgi:hypothetical protein